ncbi:MipA/OmpV family protein [Qipengyuania sediminis]|uniref:MipA/OmpV family protein n=1 Tax=Qipengyuania sediminis TaxID=1532023 RepID=UPI00105A33EF|nr:MipA/OmpV family protein [Qipengyuania sediminis]
MNHAILRASIGAALLLAAAPALAQDPGNEPRAPESPAAPAEAAIPAGSVFEGDWVTLGAGAALIASYDGSDDYVLSPLPLLQGRLGGVSINPRAAGLALDLIPDRTGATGFSLGVAARLNRNRADQIEDEVVRAYGELDTAIEVGPTVGVTFPGVLHGFDSLSISADVLWDVAGAHEGMTINPSITYFTPVSRGAAVSLSLSARHVDDSYADYYYSVGAAPAGLATGEALAAFTAEGGFDKLGANILAGIDFDGDLTNGGLAGFAIGGYSRMLGDAADTPFTRVRGSADQFFLALGVGYTF